MIMYKDVEDFADLLDGLAAFGVWTETLIEVAKDFVFGLDLDEEMSEELLDKLDTYIRSGSPDRKVLLFDFS